MRTIADITHVIYFELSENGKLLARIRVASPSARYLKITENDLRSTLDLLRAQGVPSKQIILIHQFKGRLVQKCPGSPGVICCNYLLVNTGFNCIYDCVYCFLLGYLTSYGILIFENYDDILSHVDQFITECSPDKLYRIGTGEFTDSLMIDEYTDLSTLLISRCADHPNIFLELKTKSAHVSHLLNIDKKGNTVIAWSLNTPRNIEKYEFGTALLHERLHAAKNATEAGYWVSFHFDPVIRYPGWEEEYTHVLESIFSEIDHRKILWLSVGGFRFTREFKGIMRENFPDEDITLDEFVMCPDGKLRYYKPMRVEIYRLFRDVINRQENPPFLYMCMESADMWDLIFDKNYLSSDDLEQDMMEFIKRKTGIDPNEDK